MPPDTRARGLDVSDFQDPAQMRYGDWRRLGFCFLFYQIARGLTLTAGAAQHCQLARAAGYLTGPYLYMRANTDPAAQARLLLASRGADDELPDMLDVEAAATEAQLAAFCDEHDRSGVPLAIYTGYGVWERIVPPAARARYAGYKLIVAGYPYDAPPDANGHDVQPMDPASVMMRSTPPAPGGARPLLPESWTEWWSWQHTGHGTLAGYAGFLDLEVSNMTESELRASLAAAASDGWAPPLYPGPYYGMHGQQNDQIGAITRRMHAAGLRVGAITAVENPGKLVEAKGTDPRINTVARFLHPNPTYEGGQDAERWSDATVADFVSTALAIIPRRMNPTEYQAADYIIAGWNEWKWLGSGVEMAHIWQALMRAAADFDPQRVFKVPGLHPLRLGLIAAAQGGPEYAQMAGAVGTGMFEQAAAGGHALIVHEGPFADQLVTEGQGVVIPGAPFCPPGGGSGTGRVFYWYTFPRVRIPFLVSEAYDGLGRDHPPSERVPRMRWMDRNWRRSRYYRGVTFFELIDQAGTQWSGTDFTAAFESAELLAAWQAEQDEPNPIGETNMPFYTDDQVAQIRAHVDGITTILTQAAPAQPMYMATVLIGVRVRDTAGADTGRVLTVGSQVAVYAENVTAGGYTNRVRINANGDNVTTQDNSGRPTLVKA